ncbi:hypothetical protein [Flindersiella endophytica]
MNPPELDQLLDDFVSWTRGREDADSDQARIVYVALTSKPDFPGASPRRWRKGDLTELLLEILPRTYAADPAWMTATIPALRAFFRFAADTGYLDADSAAAGELLAELEAFEPRQVTTAV